MKAVPAVGSTLGAPEKLPVRYAPLRLELARRQHVFIGCSKLYNATLDRAEVLGHEVLRSNQAGNFRY